MAHLVFLLFSPSSSVITSWSRPLFLASFLPANWTVFICVSLGTHGRFPSVQKHATRFNYPNVLDAIFLFLIIYSISWPSLVDLTTPSLWFPTRFSCELQNDIVRWTCLTFIGCLVPSSFDSFWFFYSLACHLFPFFPIRPFFMPVLHSSILLNDEWVAILSLVLSAHLFSAPCLGPRLVFNCFSFAIRMASLASISSVFLPARFSDLLRNLRTWLLDVACSWFYLNNNGNLKNRI